MGEAELSIIAGMSKYQIKKCHSMGVKDGSNMPNCASCVKFDGDALRCQYNAETKVLQNGNFNILITSDSCPLYPIAKKVKVSVSERLA